MGCIISRISVTHQTDSGPTSSNAPTARPAATPRPIRQAGVLDGLPPGRAMTGRDKAAVTIQAHWRGGQQRDLNATTAQDHTPYRTEAHFKIATHGYSGEALHGDGSHGPSENNGWQAYTRARKVRRNSLALLHSFQRRDKFEEAKQVFYTNKVPEGAIYKPLGTHDMRVNSAWMLGLAHKGTPAVITAELDNQTVVRSSARESLPAEMQTTDHNLSALAREVLGLTQHGHFSVGEPLNHMQVLVPNPSAAKATLNDFRTPGGMPQDELKNKLDEAGINTAGLSG